MGWPTVPNSSMARSMRRRAARVRMDSGMARSQSKARSDDSSAESGGGSEKACSESCIACVREGHMAAR
jgi:hypothetical protein